MDALVQKVTNLLLRRFAGSEVELELNGARRVSGILVWKGFSGREQIERQRDVWKLLRDKLSEAEQSGVSAVLTLTPEEMAAAREG